MLTSLTLHQYSTCILLWSLAYVQRATLLPSSRQNHKSSTSPPPTVFSRLAQFGHHPHLNSGTVPQPPVTSRPSRVACLFHALKYRTVATDFNHWNHHESTTLDPRICNLTNSVTRRSRPLRPAPSFRSVVRRDPIAKNFARVCRSDCYARNRHHPPPRSPSCDPLAGARSA
ncbi:hypothetical protein IWZ00DRAFT_213765 [Phyllosticta capitalensis]